MKDLYERINDVRKKDYNNIFDMVSTFNKIHGLEFAIADELLNNTDDPRELFKNLIYLDCYVYLYSMVRDGTSLDLDDDLNKIIDWIIQVEHLRPFNFLNLSRDLTKKLNDLLIDSFDSENILNIIWSYFPTYKGISDSRDFDHDLDFTFAEDMYIKTLLVNFDEFRGFIDHLNTRVSN